MTTGPCRHTYPKRGAQSIPVPGCMCDDCENARMHPGLDMLLARIEKLEKLQYGAQKRASMESGASLSGYETVWKNEEDRLRKALEDILTISQADTSYSRRCLNIQQVAKSALSGTLR